MSDNLNFKDMWAKQTSIVPNPENLIADIKKMKQSNLRKLVFTNILLIATSIIIFFIWMHYQPQLLTTKIGIILIILAMVIFLFAYNKSYSLFKNHSNTQSNSEYLKNLLAIKAKQRFMETTMLNLYFILLSMGVGLYMYEYTSRMKPIWGIVTYGITFIWILYNWFYLRPKQIKKQKAKLDAIINKFEMVNNQFND
jgi:membrane protein YdbS with pleckstrin-like domain